MLIPVREELDVFEARRTARRFAGELGFDLKTREELAIAVSELGFNILRHGIAGDMLFEKVRVERLGPGLRVTARDFGPPIANLELAVRDGYSDTGPIDPARPGRGLGCGLGAVLRFSDNFEYQAGVGEKRISIVRYLRRPKKAA
jgi:serine/threonine-protein kinase RsbT